MIPDKCIVDVIYKCGLTACIFLWNIIKKQCKLTNALTVHQLHLIDHSTTVIILICSEEIYIKTWRNGKYQLYTSLFCFLIETLQLNSLTERIRLTPLFTMIWVILWCINVSIHTQITDEFHHILTLFPCPGSTIKSFNHSTNWNRRSYCF